MNPHSHLQKILLRKREEVRALLETGFGFSNPLEENRFFDVLSSGETPRIIAETKKASPSAGEINAGMDAVTQAQLYQEGGAAAVSVLVDAAFQGSWQDLMEVAEEVEIPVLCKEFILHPVQLKLAAISGAQGVLLIAAVLGEEELVTMVEECQRLNLEPLVEVHTAQELEWALRSGTRIVGINNRNLSTFEVSLETTLTLAPLIPPEITVVCESGIKSRDDIVKIEEETEIQAFLVGETLARARDPVRALEELRGVA